MTRQTAPVPLFDDIVAAALALGGTITGEHGVGSLKTRNLDAQLGPTERELMTGIKAVFDPTGLLNPGRAYGGLSNERPSLTRPGLAIEAEHRVIVAADGQCAGRSGATASASRGDITRHRRSEESRCAAGVEMWETSGAELWEMSSTGPGSSRGRRLVRRGRRAVPVINGSSSRVMYPTFRVAAEHSFDPPR
ncbi:FAD-linked oxidase C-terminal domain-containing protein [Streptomyces avermitilis]|uniref:FAD-linked oxidase C-terminal domain-containing protein n=1 Tax=Streptomyces avermitilis TaxID=33903 RepID=UPI0033CE6EA1